MEQTCVLKECAYARRGTDRTRALPTGQEWPGRREAAAACLESGGESVLYRHLSSSCAAVWREAARALLPLVAASHHPSPDSRATTPLPTADGGVGRGGGAAGGVWNTTNDDDDDDDDVVGSGTLYSSLLGMGGTSRTRLHPWLEEANGFNLF